jgi:N-methylhydantoinase A
MSTQATTSLRRIGVDTGGTFTDCVFIDYDNHVVRVAKVPSRPAEPHAAIMRGIGELGPAARVESVTHGTTIATNAVITGDFARVGLITTRGFRDVLEIGTQMRPTLYDLRQKPRPVMIPRDLRLEVGGRIAADGEEVEPLDPADVEACAERLIDSGVEAIAIGTLFSFVNSEHEELIQRIVSERAPHLYVGRSSRISREAREYPRFVTAAINAALAPKIDPYVRELERRLDTGGVSERLYVMQSNGGVGTADRSVGEHVHQLILSGPAAGVIGGADEALRCGFDNCVTFDVGGTSADIAAVADGRPRTSVEMTLPNGVPCRLPHIEVEAIGAGGGSIAWVDAGGGLNVGPQSAGADPGPACYGLSGTEATVTDAHLHLGRLSPGGLIDGELTLHPHLAEQALGRIAERLGIDDDATALGVLAVLEENMAGAIRQAAARHGDDLRDFALVAGGGAGPLHAASLMRGLGMPAAVVPPHPGILSALGLLSANLRHDHASPLLGLVDSLGDDVITDALEALRDRARRSLEADGVFGDEQRFEAALDLRYLGQEYFLSVPIADSQRARDVVARFHELHERTFGHSAPDVAVELVSVRMVGVGLRARPSLREQLPAEHGQPIAHRDVLFDTGGHVSTAVYRREHLGLGQVLRGPAIVEQLDTTTLVPPGCVARVHPSGSLVITLSEEAR